MNKMKKLLSVVLAVVLAFSAFSVLGSAAKTAYKTVDDLNNLAAYSPYGQVTRLSTEERTSIILDALDGLLPGLNINMGTIVDISWLGVSITIDLTSVDRLCYSVDSIASTFNGTVAGAAMMFADLGILESANFDTWKSGMSRDGTANFTILSEILELLSANTTLVGKVFTDGLDLGLVSLGDMSAIEDIIFDLPSLVKSLVFPMLERWDDTLTEVKWLDTNGKGNGKVEETVNTFVKSLFTNDMSITTIKYDANGNMTSEHTNWFNTAVRTDAPGTPSNNSPRCYYQINGTTPGSVMTVYHIVDEAEAKTLKETPDKVNGSPAAYTYFKEAQTYVMSPEVEGSSTYVWKATDEWGNTWSLKWYNDNSPFLPGFSGSDFDLTTMSVADLLYTFIPPVFKNMAPVVLNGSVKKLLAEFVGVKFTHVGLAGSDAVADLGNDAIFAEEQGEYLWEWSDYAVVDGVHYYRYLDDVYVGDLSNVNNYFDIINWNYEITGDFMNEFVPTTTDGSDRLLMHTADFLTKVGNLVLLPSAETDDTRTDYTATWTRPAFAEGNENLVKNIKALAQAIVGLAPQHIFGDDYATNERCYVDLMLSSDNDTVLVGIAAHLVNMLMPSMSLPGKSDILSSGAKVGAILAAVVREFAAYLAPEYNFDALIYADYGTESGDEVKTFIAGKDAEYWLDVILTMGINVGFEYLRAFADMGEGTDEWNAFVSYSGYGVDGKTYAAGTTQAALNAEWEGMLDYVLDWALEKDYEWTWKMENIAYTSGLTIDLSTAQDPWVKLQTVLEKFLPVDEILTVNPAEGEQKIEHFLREDLILGIVNLEWAHLINTIQFNGSNKYFRTANVLDQAAKLLKGIVNNLLNKVFSTDIITSGITDFDSLANQDNLVAMVKNLVGKIYTAGVTNKGCDTLMPFLNFLLGWKTDPQVIADPKIWTSFRDGNDYAFQWTGQDGYPSIDANNTKIIILNNSAGMLETHRNSDVTDHAYDINIRNVTSDATKNTLTFTYDNVISPYEQVEIKVGGKYSADEAVTVTIEYDYVGKDGKAVGGTQYTSVSFLVSNLYEDSNLSSCHADDHDKDYTGLTDVKGYVFTEDLFTTVTEYTAEIHYVSASGSNPDKAFTGAQAEGSEMDCNGNPSKTGDVPTAPASNYFTQITATKSAPGEWASTLSKDGTSSTRAHLYKAKSGVSADTEFAYGAYDMGGMGIKYGSDTKVVYVDFIYYNDYNVYDIYTENKDNGYNAHQGVDSATWEAYRTAWNKIVYLATYPMMTTARNPANWEGVTAAGTSANDYVTAIMPQIEPAIEAFETAKEAYETALADAQASGSSDSELPSYVVALQEEIDNDFVNGKEINFQDYNFYEYFNYNDVKVDGEELYRTFLAPELMDKYYIMGSGIREEELNKVIAAESNPYIAAGITASRLMNKQEDIDAAQAAHDDWVMPTTTKLIVEDLTARIAYYKQFLAPNAEPLSYNNKAAHLYFLEKEIAFVENQGLNESDYTAASWEAYADALDIAKKVAAGNDPEGFSNFNSRVYDVKYNLMVAYKNLLAKADSLIEAGGTAALNANIDIAEAIFASLEAGDGVWALAADYEGEADAAYAELIKALGYYYVGEDGNTWDLYADSAYEYADNDRPNRQSNQAKVDAANFALEKAIANFETAEEPSEPNTLVLNENAPFEAIIDTMNGGEFDGAIYGFDTLGWNDEFIIDGTIADFVTTAYGDEYLEVIVGDSGVETTGTIINVLDEEGNVVESYVYIYFGDMDMDGGVGAGDAQIAEFYELNFMGIDTLYQFMAGDLDSDSMPGASDALVMEFFELNYFGMVYQADVAVAAQEIPYEIF